MDTSRLASITADILFAAADMAETVAQSESDIRRREDISKIEGDIRAAATDLLAQFNLIDV